MKKHAGGKLDTDIFYFYRRDIVLGGDIETDQAITDTATRTLDTFRFPRDLDKGILTAIKVYMEPTAAETYQLYLLRGAAADDITQRSYVIYDSGALMAGDTWYHDFRLKKPFKLVGKGLLYYILDWSGAPGNTLGFIEASGEQIA